MKISFNGYKCYTWDTCYSKGGGLCTLIRDHLVSEEVPITFGGQNEIGIIKQLMGIHSQL